MDDVCDSGPALAGDAVRDVGDLVPGEIRAPATTSLVAPHPAVRLGEVRPAGKRPCRPAMARGARLTGDRFDADPATGGAVSAERHARPTQPASQLTRPVVATTCARVAGERDAYANLALQARLPSAAHRRDAHSRPSWPTAR